MGLHCQIYFQSRTIRRQMLCLGINLENFLFGLFSETSRFCFILPVSNHVICSHFKIKFKNSLGILLLNRKIEMTKPHRNDKAKITKPWIFGILILEILRTMNFLMEETFYLLSLVSFILNILSLYYHLIFYHLMPTLHCIFNI